MIPHIRDFKGQRIHLIGIGGSSMSGLAEMLIDQGYRVTGSDRDEGYLIHHVREKGAEVMIGHRAENVRGAALVCYSAAIHPDNPERAEADRRRLRELTAAGGQRIAEAKALHDRLEDCYRQAMDYAKVEEIKASLLARLVEAERE